MTVNSDSILNNRNDNYLFESGSSFLEAQTEGSQGVSTPSLYQRIASRFWGSSYAQLGPEEPFSFENHQKAADKLQKNEAEIRDNTIFWRVSGKDLGLDNDKPYDMAVGIVDGQLKYAISSRNLQRTPAGSLTQSAVALGLGAASLASYVYTGEGVLTKGLVASLASFVIPKLEQIPYVPAVAGPLVATIGSYFISTAFDSNAYLKFGFVAGVGICATLYKRGGKGLATGGWSGVKKYIIPRGLTESGLTSIPKRAYNWIRRVPSIDQSNQQEHRKVDTIQLTAVNQDDSAQVPVSLELTSYDNDMYFALVLGDKKFSPIKMATKDDDDDDDDDQKVKVDTKAEAKPSKKEKKKETSWEPQIKEGALFVGSGLLTATSKYFLGEGITTAALTTIFSASVKAKLRLMPFLNGYGLLTAATAGLGVIKILQPDSLIGDLYFMPAATLVSMANKDIKDRLVTGKYPKNPHLYGVPLFIQKLVHKATGWKPAEPAQLENPLATVLDETSHKKKIKFDAQLISPLNQQKEIKATLKIKGRKLTGEYDLTSKEKKELHLGRMKAKKLGKGPEAAFILTSIGATLLASYLTRLYQGGSLNNDPLRIDSQKLGEGVATTILNSVFATYMKQFGKKIPPIPRDGGLLLTAVGAIALERFLMSEEMLPFLFSSIPTSGFLAIQAKKAKQWVYNKPYGKMEGWITTKHPTNGEIAEKWASLKKAASKTFCCTRDDLPQYLSQQNDNDQLLINRNGNTVEVLVLPEQN